MAKLTRHTAPMAARLYVACGLALVLIGGLPVLHHTRCVREHEPMPRASRAMPALLVSMAGGSLHV